MPNWNSNNLTVKGDPKDVLLFIEENFMTRENPYSSYKGTYDYVLDFEKIHPTPTKVNGDIIDEWYEWRNSNWGCKWAPSFEQCNSLTFILNGKEDESIIKTYYNNRGKNSNIFDENMIVKYKKMYETDDNPEVYDEAELSTFFETPWCPPEGMIVFWSERYKNTSLEFRCSYYEPGMCFAGEYRINCKDDDERIVDDCYTLNNPVEYKTYILDEGWENLEYIQEDLLELLKDLNPDMDEKMLDLLNNKVKETLENAENNKQRALLICDIEERWRDNRKLSSK